MCIVHTYLYGFMYGKQPHYSFLLKHFFFALFFLYAPVPPSLLLPSQSPPPLQSPLSIFLTVSVALFRPYYFYKYKYI